MMRGSQTENNFQYLAYIITQTEETGIIIKDALLKTLSADKIKLLKNCYELPKHFKNPTYIVFEYNAVNISYIAKIGYRRNLNLFAYVEDINNLTEKNIIELIKHKIDHALYPQNIGNVKYENFVDSKIFKKKITGAFIDIESSLLNDINIELEENIYGISYKLKKIVDGVKKIALSDSNVLITGESGTGKELVARLIHQKSKRNKKNIIPVNCGAVPGELLESELFGYKKGAFTGAYADKPGRFELANQSTIFLDEIGDMNFSLQVKLLRVIQEHEIEPVGSIKPTKVDCRIITATNKNLEELVSKKLFREDLFYRINVIPIYILPLRERKPDIILLIYHFLKKLSSAKNNLVYGMSENAVKILLNYDWFGNVRELENIIEMLVVLNEKGVISEDEIPDKYFKTSDINRTHNLETGLNTNKNGININNIKKKTEIKTAIYNLTSNNNIGGKINNHNNKNNNNLLNSLDLGINHISLKNEVEQFELNLIMQALEISNGVKDKAAKILGINRTTLIEKLKRYGSNNLK